MIGEILDDIVDYISPYENEVMTVFVTKCLEFGMNEKDIPAEFINLTSEFNEYIPEETDI